MDWYNRLKRSIDVTINLPFPKLLLLGEVSLQKGMSQAKTSTKPSFRFLLACTLLFFGGFGDICKTGCKNSTITENNGVGNISQLSINNQIVVGVPFHCMTRMYSYRQRWDLFWDSLYRNELPAIKNPVPNYNFCYEREYVKICH